MTRVIEAIYTHGVLEPLEPLNLKDRQRVEIIIRPVNGPDALPEPALTEQERKQALKELFDAIERDNLQLNIRMPTRDEMHERG